MKLYGLSLGDISRPCSPHTFFDEDRDACFKSCPTGKFALQAKKYKVCVKCPAQCKKCSGEKSEDCIERVEDELSGIQCFKSIKFQGLSYLPYNFEYDSNKGIYRNGPVGIWFNEEFNAWFVGFGIINRRFSLMNFLIKIL